MTLENLRFNREILIANLDVQAIGLRERMHERAETFNLEFPAGLISEATAKLDWFQNRPDDIEVAQLYHQFLRLDIDKDGIEYIPVLIQYSYNSHTILFLLSGFIDVEDTINLIKFVDPDLVLNEPQKVQEMSVMWLRDESVDPQPTNSVAELRWTFANYVKVVMAKREKDKQM